MKRFPILAFVLTMIAFSGPILAQTWNSDVVEFSRLAGFSQAMVVDGTQIIATRTGESAMFPSPATQKGGVFVFRNAEDGWEQAFEIIPEDVQVGDQFGQAMALEGDWLAVSASGANQGCGVVIVFQRDASAGWMQRSLLNNPACELDERFGWSLDFFEDRLFVGAPGVSEHLGAVFVFEHTDAGWELERHIEGREAGESFGETVVAEAGGLLVGAPDAFDGNGIVYAFDGFNLSEKPHSLTSDNEAARLFGLEIAWTGNEALIAAPGMRARQNVGGQPKPGMVFAFEKGAETWEAIQTIELSSDGNASRTSFGFGTALAVHGNEAWIGAPFGGSMAGAVHVYTKKNQMWEKRTSPVHAPSFNRRWIWYAAGPGE